ncbi:MAG: glycogen-binding domain-containing protein [Nitrospiraceae bacterium]|nr:glycogen-binding domain-containing protein [Nitrospiraceae bacterium]
MILDDGVRFSIKAPDAKKVAIAGSFNQWDTEKDTLAGPDEEGRWSIVLPLAEGRYEYLFFIDSGKWVADPDSPSADDGLGGKNSVFVLKKP